LRKFWEKVRVNSPTRGGKGGNGINTGVKAPRKAKRKQPERGGEAVLDVEVSFRLIFILWAEGGGVCPGWGAALTWFKGAGFEFKRGTDQDRSRGGNWGKKRVIC